MATQLRYERDPSRGSFPREYVVISPETNAADACVRQQATSQWINVRNLVTNNGLGRYRKLTLNDFPMEYGVKDAQQRSLTSRQERSRLQDRLQSARKESETLREYSRRRFQTVVDWEKGQTGPLAPTTPINTTTTTSPYTQPSTRRPRTTTGARQQLPVPPPQAPSTPTNGPTKDGSILYNGKPLLLSAIRARPNSEPPSRFDHLRGAHGKAYPYIQRTLEQSNCEYRVGATPCGTARGDDRRDGSLSPDFVMLIPVMSEVSDVTAKEEEDDVVGDRATDERLAAWQKGQAWTEDAPLLASTARSRSPRSEERSEDKVMPDAPGNTEEGQGQCDDMSRDVVEMSRGHSPTGAAGNTPAVTVPTIPQSTPPTAAPAPLSPPRQPPSPRADPVARHAKQTVPPPTPHLTTSTPARPPSSTPTSRPHSAMSEVSSVSSVSFTPRPHCWVDDATVSSDESLTERALSVQNDADDRLSLHSQDHGVPRAQLPGTSAHLPRVPSPSHGGEKKKAVSLAKRVTSPLLKRSPSGGKAKAGGCPRSLKHSSASGSKAGGKSVSGEAAALAAVMEGQGVGAEGEEEEEAVLPRFLCPSSESKSRQAALKEWLAKTSFATACRTVPLM
ncbi:uncharacterized protein LOC143280236 [Babylonia areolata]|uniref:uncharacterized protein LOC143280236 n=1 Tax=Babylonia areolata TaxID=304850 RepID=UPI003FD4F9D4